ncbi:MAG: hypothetical protein EXR05_05505 [Acetobacteraceae bacterium]|nr:hypothetical protein [Acetobacteraceae bacterium]MSP31058.1 hypothetical protein [Acetobacteraceae bacterium]
MIGRPLPFWRTSTLPGNDPPRHRQGQSPLHCPGGSDRPTTGHSLALRRPPPGAILVPDMAPPIRIQNVARKMTIAARLLPSLDITTQFTRPREGEKLTELPCHAA